MKAFMLAIIRAVGYTAFISGDPGFLSWCRDLFLRGWGEARPAAEP